MTMAGNLFPALFVGNYDHALDAQGRVCLPSDWRDKDGETELIMIPARSNALLLLPIATFMEFCGKAAKLAIANSKIQMALAYLGSESRRCRCDKQGRIALDKEKLASIGVNRKLKMIGAITHIRICSPENWQHPENPDDCLNEIQQVCESNDDFAGLLRGVLEK